MKSPPPPAPKAPAPPTSAPPPRMEPAPKAEPLGRAPPPSATPAPGQAPEISVPMDVDTAPSGETSGVPSGIPSHGTKVQSGIPSVEPQEESGIRSAFPYARDAVFGINRELPPLEVRPSVPHRQWCLTQLAAPIKYAWTIFTRGSTVGCAQSKLRILSWGKTLRSTVTRSFTLSSRTCTSTLALTTRGI